MQQSRSSRSPACWAGDERAAGKRHDEVEAEVRLVLELAVGLDDEER
jgi:hypothetical protein